MATLDEKDIKTKIVSVIKDKLSIDSASEIENAKSFEDLGADSLDLVEIIMSLEEKFNIEITDDEAENITSVDQAVQLIIKKQK